MTNNCYSQRFHQCYFHTINVTVHRIISCHQLYGGRLVQNCHDQMKRVQLLTWSDLMTHSGKTIA